MDEKADNNGERDRNQLELSLSNLEIDLLNPLGKGGFCMVYRVTVQQQSKNSTTEEDTTKTEYALKKLKTGVRNAKLAREHLQSETDLLASLKNQHLNIIQLKGYGYDEATLSPFLVVEILEDTLESKLEIWNREQEKNKPHPVPAEIVRGRLQHVALGVARGMAFLHSQKVVFRDLKPDNIGFSATRDVKLFDFGLAAKLDPPDYECHIRAGTIRYVAPEIADGYIYSFKVDVYSYAILLWQIITTRLPFEKELGVDDPFKVTIQRNFLPTDKRPSLKYVESEELQKLLKKIWHSHPDKRPTFDQLLSKLEEIVGPINVPIEDIFPELTVKIEDIQKDEAEQKEHKEPPVMAWWKRWL